MAGDCIIGAALSQSGRQATPLASGEALLRREHACPDRDDRERFSASPGEAGRLAEYLHELTAFPKGKHDDQVDSTAQMLDWFKQPGPEPGGIYQYFKELYEA